TPRPRRYQRTAEGRERAGKDQGSAVDWLSPAGNRQCVAEHLNRTSLQRVAEVRCVAPHCAQLPTTHKHSYVGRKVPNKNAEAVRKVMFELSAETGAAVWDTYGVMGGHGSIRQWEEAGLAKKDLVHFNRAGYTVLADLLFAALMENYGEHLRKIPRP